MDCNMLMHGTILTKLVYQETVIQKCRIQESWVAVTIFRPCLSPLDEDRALYKNVEKHSNSKSKIFGFFINYS